jgi:hypothetical protein
VLELECPPAAVSVESGAPTLRGNRVEQIETVKGFQCPEDALREGLGAPKTREISVTLVRAYGGADPLRSKVVLWHQNVPIDELRPEYWRALHPITTVQLLGMMAIRPTPEISSDVFLIG